MLDLHNHPHIFRDVLDSLQTGVCLLDRQHTICFWNEGAARITGYHRHEVVGHHCRQNVLPNCDLRACAYCGATCPLTPTALDGKPVHSRMDLRHKQGHRIPVMVWMVPIRDEHGSLIGIAQSFDRPTPMHDERRQHQNLAMYGCLDDITGIPNPSFTEFNVRENLNSFAKYHLPFGIMLICIDALEHFQSSYGHEAAAAILRVVAQTMRNALRPSDFLGRWHGDQFLAILMNSTAAGVAAASERINRLVGCAGLQWWGDELEVTTSLGAASVRAEDTLQSLLERAEQSLQQHPAKRAAAASTQTSSAKE
jgi:diguanylate cyclase (GGDEF)-like protein/PAS domain S-box-containing protein